MLGFKGSDPAVVTITGIELVEKIKKDQFKIGKLPGRPATAPETWAALLAAEIFDNCYNADPLRSFEFAPEP